MQLTKNLTFWLIIIILIMLALYSLSGCASSVKTTSTTEETTTVQPVSVTIPEIHEKVNLPGISPDSISNYPYGIYSRTDVVSSKDPLTGQSHKAQVTTTVTVKKNILGKPQVTAETTVNQEPITTQAQVIEKKNSETKTAVYTSFFDKIKWYLLGLILFVAAGFIILKKFFPAALKLLLKV